MNFFKKLVSNLFIECEQCEKMKFISFTQHVVWDGECDYGKCRIEFNLCLKCSKRTNGTIYSLDEFWNKVKKQHELDYHKPVNFV